MQNESIFPCPIQWESKTMRGSPVYVCPVPTEQQPVNEYEQLKESCFFRWATLNWLGYWRKLAWVWGWGLIVAEHRCSREFSSSAGAASVCPLWCSGSGYIGGVDAATALLRLVVCARSPHSRECMLRRVGLVRWANLAKTARSSNARSPNRYPPNSANSSASETNVCYPSVARRHR